MRVHAVYLALLAGLLAATSATAQPATTLAPGSTFTFRFPDMPPTFANLLDNAAAGPQMTVSLPGNYDPGKKHPLLIFLSGGSGGTAGNPSVARALSEEKDFVCVSLPLFKEKLDPPTPGSGVSRILIRDADARYAWPLYKRMLAKLAEVVPNLDPEHRVLGGFSNGAHMVAGLVNQTDGEAAGWFSAFFLVDGGGGLRRFDLIKRKPLLDVCGRWRPNPKPALDAGVQLTVYRMKVAQHAFPASEYAPVRDWLRGRPVPPGGPAEEATGLKVGDKAPSFELMGTDGQAHSLAQLAGRSAVALCWYLRAGSRGSQTELSAIQAEMAKLSEYRVQVLGITFSKLAENQAFAKELGLTFPLLSDPQCAAGSAYGTVRNPKGPFGSVAERWVFLIDDQGVIRSIEKDEDVESKGKLLVKALEEATIPKK